MKHNYIFLSILTLILSSCSEERFNIDDPSGQQRIELKLQALIDQTNVSRADDSGFANGDHIGVFAVSYADNGNPGILSPQGNLADNVCFKFDEFTNIWTGDRSILFPDDKTPVDFYGYYPYNNILSATDSYHFNVARNQSTEPINSKPGGYEASDFLWAKTACAVPSSPNVTLTFKHILAAVQVTLVEGSGFNEGEWAQLDKSILVSGTIPDATIDLSTGIVTPASSSGKINIIANPYKDDFRAIVIPQTVAAGETLLAITVDGHSYMFSKEEAMTYSPTKLHKFTIQVTKSVSKGDYEFTLLGEAITAWESDPVSHNGKVKEYVVVDVPKAGGLEAAVKAAGLVPKDIVNLKINGELTESDFRFIREDMKYIEALNLKEVTIRNCSPIEFGRPGPGPADYILPYQACKDMSTLKSVVLPNKLLRIGQKAFKNTILRGYLNLPEGLEYIYSEAFSSSKRDIVNTGFTDTPDEGLYNACTSTSSFTGQLIIPSSVKYIGGCAFAGCDFSGELILPEKLEFIGSGAFADCQHITGELHLPNSLKTVGNGAFDNMKSIIGRLFIPDGISTVLGFAALNYSSITFMGSPLIIGTSAFKNSSLKGDITIPSSVIAIDESAFFGTKISHATLPDNIETIGTYAFGFCKFLQDTIVLPTKIRTIQEGTFKDCEKLQALKLPAELDKIEAYAFENCFSLEYIYCAATIPPVLDNSSFIGVEKDNFTVEVPEESVDAYRNAPGWSEFKRISAYRNFVARPSKYNVLNKGGKKEIVLNADSEWEMTECPSWCHIDRTSGSQKTTITLTVDAMAKGSAMRSGKVTFKLKGFEEHLTHIDIGQYDYKYDEDQYLALQTASKGNGIDLVFIGDGYDAADISTGTYLEDMKQEMEYFFGVEPYTTYRDYFNVYTAFALSEDSGVESLNTWRNTKFHVSTGSGSSPDWMRDDRRLTGDWQAAFNYCAENIPPLLQRPDPRVGCILVGNTDIYEGITYIGDSFCAIVTKSADSYPYDARGVLQHEACGHGMGFLGDEYIYHYDYIQRCECFCCSHVDNLLAEQSFGYSLNLSLNGKFNDVPWNHLATHPKYRDIVDIYEGGYFHSRGVYRSEVNSCMNNNVPYFSTWSRELIVRRIKKLAGEDFDFNDFVAKDSREIGRDFTSTSRNGELNPAVPARHGNAPIKITGYKFGKKGGRK